MVDCGDPGDPYGGYRHIATDTNYQSIVTYTCKPDHHLEGEDSQVCQANGQWSGSKPVCLGMYFKFGLVTGHRGVKFDVIPAKFTAKLPGKLSVLIQERDRTKRHEILLRVC